MTIHENQILAYVGGAALERYGCLTRRIALPQWRGEDGAEVFTRSFSAVGVGHEGIHQVVAADRPRAVWRELDGVFRPCLGIEGQEAQLISEPENFDAEWTDQGIGTATGGIDDPFGGAAAYRLARIGGAGDGRYRVVPFGTDGVKAAAVFLRQNTATVNRLSLIDLSVNRHVVDVTWVDGVPVPATASGGGVGSGFIFPVRRALGDWWRVAFNADGIVAAEENRMYILPGPVDVNGAVDVFCANAWDRLYPGSPKRQSFATSSADEDFTVPLHALPDQITAHAVVARPYWADLAGTLPASPRICSVGTDSALEIRAAASSRIAVANIKQPSTVEATSGVFPAGPLVVTAQWRDLRTAGSCRVNVGAGWSAWSAAATGPTPLIGNTFNVGRGSSNHLDGDLRALILARGHHEPGAFAEWIP